MCAAIRGKVRELADGRVYTAAQALEYKLIDRLGVQQIDLVVDGAAAGPLDRPHRLEGRISGPGCGDFSLRRAEGPPSAASWFTGQ